MALVRDVVWLVVLLWRSCLVHSHGAMQNPPARNVAWRDNSDYNGLNCGGYGYQWSYAQGRCGVCGDPWNEANTGRYVYPNPYNPTRLIVAVYSQAQVIDVDILVTANHRGYFVFRIGEVKASELFTQASLNRVLKTVDGQEQWQVPTDSLWTTTFRIQLKLPSDLTCNHCVLQWWWRCGNNWGCDPPPTSTCGLGFGSQENFVNCADVQITPDSSIVLPTQEPSTAATNTPASSTTGEHTSAVSTTGVSTPETATGTEACVATNIWSNAAGMNGWCKANCFPPYSNCPESMCSSGCRAVPDSVTLAAITTTSTATTKATTTTSAASTTGVSTATATTGISTAAKTTAITTAATTTAKISTQSATKAPCASTGAWKGSPSMTAWCKQNCYHNPPYCPKEQCSDGCRS